MKKVYIASPFFNPEQVAVVEAIEGEISKFANLSFYPPRLDGVLMNMTKEERASRKTEIFRNNCDNIENCDLVIAVIDGRDTGTIWELGFAFAFSQICGAPDIVTYTNQDFGLNVMIQESVDGHLKGIADLKAFLLDYINPEIGNPFANYRNFNEGAY